jgi:hypothetical protein
MTPKQQAKDDLARMRAETSAYAKRAADNRQRAIDLRKRRDWLGALQADCRASEYRQTRDRYAADAPHSRAMGAALARHTAPRAKGA